MTTELTVLAVVLIGAGAAAFVLQLAFALPKLWELEDRIKRLELDQLHRDEEKSIPNTKANRTMLDGIP